LVLGFSHNLEVTGSNPVPATFRSSTTPGSRNRDPVGILLEGSLGIAVNIKIVREALHKEPFEPFAIRLADGRSVPVPHPDFVAVGRRRVHVILEDDSGMTIEPFMIVSLDTSERKGKSGNGKHRGD